MFTRVLKICFISTFILFFLTGNRSFAQSEGRDSVQSTHNIVKHRLNDTLRTDSLINNSRLNDTLRIDSRINNGINDTLKTDTISGRSKKREEVLSSKVEYSSSDSMIISIKNKKLYLFNDAAVKYGDIDLKASYVEFDMKDNTVIAKGLPDSVGTVKGTPVFTEGDEKFESSSLKYNFKSKKGYINQVFTEEGDGYLHSSITKRLPDGQINIKNGKYTTCDLNHPHFYLGLTKAIVIPNDKIIAGPSYMVLEDIPLPIILPFGYFPNSKTRTSGLIFPRYGQEQRRGFYLRDGGWYFALNDYFDLRLIGDIYSKGTFGINAQSNYRKRYKFSGAVAVRFYRNKVDDDPTFTPSKDYSIRWSHSQDPKANPTRTFAANVNISSTSYDKNQSYNYQDHLTNTKASSISFSKNWPGTPFNLTASMNHTQNSRTKAVDLNLPRVSFNMSTIYPFRKKANTGDYKWYENIGLSYAANLDNQIHTFDSLLFKSYTVKHMNNGFQQSIPFYINLKPIKIVNISPSLNYKGVLYTRSIKMRYIPVGGSLHGVEIANDTIVTDTIFGLKYAQAFYPSISVSINPKIYGMFVSKKPNSYIIAVRHFMQPSIGFSFVPDLRSLMPNYYDTVYYPSSTDSGKMEKLVYSYFDSEIYKPPTFNGKSGSVTFSLNNNLEMKVRSKNDTINKTKKISILDNLSFATSYNPFADSLRWTDISMNGGTSLLNGKINVRFGGNFSPYAIDKNGRKYNKSEFSQSGKLARLTSANITMGVSFTSEAGKDKQNQTNQQSEQRPTDARINPESGNDISRENDVYGNYVDFKIPWSFRINYNWSYNKPAFKASYTHTINISGDFSLTPKWKIGANTGYDLISKKLNSTNISIYRDLHCWQMNFAVVPFGYYKSYSFTIRAKAALLQDLKIDKRGTWYDNY